MNYDLPKEEQERLRRENPICINCHCSWGEHSRTGDYCPSYHGGSMEYLNNSVFTEKISYVVSEEMI